MVLATGTQEEIPKEGIDMMNDNNNMVVETTNIDFKDTNNEQIRRRLQQLDNYRFPRLSALAMQSTKEAFEDIQEHCMEQSEFIHYLVSKVACSGSAQFQTWAGTQNSNFQKVWNELLEANKALMLSEQKVAHYEGTFVREMQSKVAELEKALSSAHEQIEAEKEASKSTIEYWKDQASELTSLQRRYEELSARNTRNCEIAKQNYHAAIRAGEELKKLRSKSDMQARDELNRTARRLQMAESDLEEANKVIDERDAEIEKLKLEIEELKKQNLPQSREPSIPVVGFKGDIDPALMRDVKQAAADGMSKRAIKDTFHIGIEKVNAILSMPEGVVAMG